MAASPGSIYTVRQPFSLLRRMADGIAARYLERRAMQNAATGYPGMSVFTQDYIGREIIVRGRFEDEELLVMRQSLQPFASRFATGSALDIGANIGNHALFFSSMFATVHVFEPNPRTFALLSTNAELADNVAVHNVALGQSAGQLQLSFDPANIGEASLVGQRVKGGHAANVKVERLDDVLPEGEPVTFIKLDVEGFELAVLKGADRVLRSMPIIAFEQNVEAFVDNRSPVAELLCDYGYRLCILAKRDVGGNSIGTAGALVRKMINGIRYDLIPVDRLEPKTQSVILAMSSADLALLSRRPQ